MKALPDCGDNSCMYRDRSKPSGMQIHRSPLLWEEDMKRWATFHGFGLAWKEIHRRCERARASQHPEKETRR